MSCPPQFGRSHEDTNITLGKIVKREQQNSLGIASLPLNGNSSSSGKANPARSVGDHPRKVGKFGGGIDGLLSASALSRNRQLESVEVPKGWSRIIEKGDIIYISPNRSRLRSVSDVIAYLVAPATCKCGLVCPFKLEDMFNFNPSLISRPLFQRPSQGPGVCDSCKVNGGFEAILPQFSPEKIMRMLRKGSKKKKKKSKNPEKEGKKRNRHNKKGQGSDPLSSQSIQSWINSGMPGSSSTGRPVALPGSVHGVHNSGRMPYGSDSKPRYFPDHGDYVGPLAPKENSMNSENKAQVLLSDPSHQAPRQKKSSSSAPRPGLPNMSPSDDKATVSKVASKKPGAKQKRIPKTKEDLNIASMMGRVKQQVGEIDKIRTSQMFTSANPGPTKPPAASTLNEPVKGKANPLSEMKAGKQVLANNLPTSTGVLNLIRTKAPPNVTLPASHSNMLPQALAEGVKASMTTADHVKAQQSSSVNNARLALTDTQHHNWNQDPRFFAGKAITNVYWGSKEHSSLNDMLTPSTESGIPQTQKNDSASLPHSLNDVAGTLKSEANRARVKVETVTSSEHLIEQAEKDKMLLAALNSIKDQRNVRANSEQHLADRPETIPSKSSAATLAIQNNQQSKEHALAADANRQFAAQLKTQDTGAHSSLQALATAKSPTQPAKQNVASSKENVISNEAQINSKDSRIAVAASEVHASAVNATENPGKASQMVVFQVVSQPNSTKPVSGVVSTPPAGTGANTTTAQQVSYQGYYGIPNTASVPRAPSAAYQNSVAANNPAQFLIMGSQASQALQHLALQQSNALQVSLQRAENSHPMYLQTLPGYSPNAIKTTHPNIGFAYASVPIQFMTIGGAQVVGKQPQAQAANVERYQSLYQYYQGVRPAEAASKTDAGKHVTSQTTTLMYPGVNPFGQTPNNYVRIAPAHVSNRIPLPPQADTKPLVSLDALKSDPQLSEMLSVTQSVSKQNIFAGSATTTGLPSKPERTQKSTTSASVSEKKCQLTTVAKSETNSKQDGTERPHILTPALEEHKASTVGEAPRISDIDPRRTPSDSIVVSPAVNAVASHQLSVADENGQKPVSAEVVLSSIGSLVSGDSSAVRQHAVITEPLDISSDSSNVTEDSAKVIVKHEEQQDELSLQCNEHCNTASGESRTPTPEKQNRIEFSNGTSLRVDASFQVQDTSPSLNLGDLIWGHQKGYSAWPGKIVTNLEVKEPCADAGKVWVKWYGEHTHSQMELSSLKSLKEGLMEYRNSCRRRKNRSAKKTAESLELAISEALREASFSPTTTKALRFDTDEGAPETKKPKR